MVGYLGDDTDNTAAFMAIQSQSQDAILPQVTTLDLTTFHDNYIALMQQIMSSMPFVPQNLDTLADQTMQLGAFPLLNRNLSPQDTPSWLQDPTAAAAWHSMIIGPYQSISSAFLSQNLSALEQATADAQANVDFWNTVYNVDALVASPVTAVVATANAAANVLASPWKTVAAVGAIGAAALLFFHLKKKV